ncbi:MAG: LamG-like jellyroll fold domain-containing protein [Planctomycetota bacterium]
MWRKPALLICAGLVLGLVGRARGFEELLKVDIGTGGAVEPGFVGIGEDTDEEPYIVPDVNGTGIDIMLETTCPGNWLGFRDNGFHPLYGDLVHVNDWFGYAVIMTLGGLSPGTYSMESYHNNIWTAEAAVSNLDILVNEELVLEDVQQSRTQTGPFASAVFVFTVPSGQTSAEIKFQPTGEPPGGWSNVALNGFILYSGMAAGLKASEPSPAYKAEDVCPQALTLSWKPGDYAVTHDIYFGTSLSDVNESATAVVTGHDSNSWTAPTTLELGTTYYWRVDEVNDTDVWTGDVWWFVTQTGRAFDPVPVDDERGTPSGDTELRWAGSCLASSHNVYFGTSFSDVNDATTSSPQYQDNVSETSYAVSTDPFTLYYWRIDEVGAGTVKGDVWSFRTGLGGILMWYMFDGMQGSDLPDPITDDTGNVTFTKYIDVNYPGSIEYAGSNPIYNTDTGTSADFEPMASLYRPDPCTPTDLLRLDGYRYTIEMWICMDAAPDDDDYALIEKDDIWSMGINEDRVLEYWHAGDDDRYNVLEATGYPLRVGEWYHVAATFDFGALPRHKLYIDGGLATSRDACINNHGQPLLNPSGNMAPVGIGCRARGGPNDEGEWFQDFFNGKIDELRVQDVILKPGQFLTVPGPEWASNPNPYNGRRGVEPNDPNLVLSWTPGTTADSHNVYFGTDHDDVENAGTVGAEFMGNVDVNHYPENGSLLLEYGKTYYWRIDEVNGIDTWKGVVWRFTTRYEIVDPNLILWYRFDEEQGTTAVDYSGHELHGDCDDAANWDPNGGWEEGCLIFDDDTAVLTPYGTLEGINSEVTVAVWLYGMVQKEQRDNWVVDAGGGYYYLQVKVPDGTRDVYLRAGNESNDVLIWEQAKPDGWIDSWHHFGFVKDENAGQISMYFDGQLVDSNSVVNSTLSNLARRELKIGAKLTHSSDYEGKMDEFRLYNRALTAAEVQALFRGGDLGIAWGPQPFNGERDVDRNVLLTWKPGDYAVSHVVYLGTAWDDVNDADTLSSVYKGTQGPNEYDPGALELETTYYWRIDEVNGPNTWKGRVWRFQVADFLIVDDMESYNAIPGSGNEIYDTWDDGFMNWTGSQVALEYASVRIHEGVQSMRFAYNNAIAYYKYSEADANTTGPRPGNLKVGTDWTEAEVKAMTLFFYGEAGNDTTEQMYAAVEDSSKALAVAEYGDLGEDMADVAVADWHQWDIPLSAFADNGVTLTDVNKVRFGFGDRVTPVAGGSGIVYFDDIRLYQPKCVPWLIKPAADLSDNCIVDFDDVVILAEDWLRTDRQFDTVQQPDYARRVGWWKLDNDAYDDSGNFFDGTVEGDYAWVGGHIGAGALELKGGSSRVLVPHAVLLSPQDEVSVCAWVNYSATPSYSARVVAKGADTGDHESYALQVTDDDTASFFVRDVNTTLYGTDSSSELRHGEWTHIAGTFDGNEVRCYVNGELSNSEAVDVPGILVDTNDLAIGNRADATNRAFIGIVDDVQVYEYGLSDVEIAHIATGGTGYLDLTALSNLYNEEAQGQRTVNFRETVGSMSCCGRNSRLGNWD